MAQRGFSLIEMMVVVSILAILVALAAPSFTDALARSKISNGASSLASSLALARSEAIKRGTTITVCKSSDGAACADGGNWEQGWIVFQVAGTPLRVFEALPAGVVATGVANPIQFSATGSVGAVANFSVCKPGVQEKVVQLTLSGRVRVAGGAVCS